MKDQTPPGTPARILVVDDNDDNRDILARRIRRSGFQPEMAANGRACLEALAGGPFDTVLLDISMPDQNGLQVLTSIRETWSLEELPVIMVTAKTQDLAKILAFKQGVQQYVTKPFNIMELSARISSLAAGRRRMMGETAIGSDGDFRKLAVRKGGRTVLLNIDDIVFLSARNKSTYAHTYENQYLVDLTLGDLEKKLSKESFARVHRSYMINLNKVKEITRVEGSYVVVAADRDETQIPVARRQVKTFREAVGI